MPARILHIEDNLGDRVLMRRQVESSKRDWLVEGVGTLAEGLAVENADIVLLDLGLPDSQGLETLARFRAARPSMPIVVLTGHSDGEMAMQALREGADDFLSKDTLTTAYLLRSVDLALERRRLRLDLVQSKQNFAAIVQASRDPIWVFNDLGHTLFANAAALELQGDSDTQLGPNPEPDSVHLLGRGTYQLKVTPTLWFDEPCSLVMAYDVTTLMERKAETERLRQALYATRRRQDMERLATGLAHSINNALVGVLSVAARVDPISAAQLTEATRQIRGITHLMGTFSDDQTRLAAPSNLGETLRVARLELLDQASNHLEFNCSLTPEVQGAHFSKEYLRPILWALMDNALLAGCRKVWLRARVEQGFALVEWECQKGRSAQWEPAAWEELRSSPGALALTAAQAFAVSAGGRAELWLSPGQADIRLCLYLPITTLSPRVTRPQSEALPTDQAEGLRTLVVDDDKLVRRVICTTLRRRGYRVFEAAEGQEGLAVAQREELDVIVCDVRMPRMDGPTMVRALRESGDTTPVLMISGYSEIEMPEGAQISSLGKPFLPADLVDAISNLLE